MVKRTDYSLAMPTRAAPADALAAEESGLNGTAANSTSLSVGAGAVFTGRYKEVEAASLVLIIVASLAANCMVFYVFYRKPSLLTISNRFVLNLTIGNFLITVLLMPVVLASQLHEAWTLGAVYCSVTGVLTTLLFTACVLSLLLITLDRYHAITKPFRYSATITSGRATLFIALVWAASGVISLPPLVGLGYISYQPDKGMCTVEWASAAVEDRLYAFLLVLGCFVLPLGLMVWVYVIIFRTVQRTSALARNNSIVADMADGSLTQQMIAQAVVHQQRRRSSMASLVTQINAFRRRSSIGNRSILSLHRGDQKAAKTGLMVLSTFVVCWLPFYIVITAEAATARAMLVPHWVQVTSIWMVFTGCALNPLVYVFRSKPIKLELLTALRLHGLAARGRHHANGAGDVNTGVRENGIISAHARCAGGNGCRKSGALRCAITPNNSAASLSRQVSDVGGAPPEVSPPPATGVRVASVAFTIAPPDEQD